jgi:hypothetical protein
MKPPVVSGPRLIAYPLDRPEKGETDVHIKELYSIIVTDKRAECRNFYVPVVRLPGRLRSVMVRLPRRQRRPLVRRRFGLHDPSATWIDVIQQIDPAPGFWDKYLT